MSRGHLTNGGVAHEGLLVLYHGVNSKLLAVVCSDDGDGWLLLGGDGGHLPHNLHKPHVVSDKNWSY